MEDPMPTRRPRKGTQKARGARKRIPAAITHKTTVEKFIKEHSDLRVRAEAVDRLYDRLGEIAMGVVKKASEIARADDRKTLFDEDIDRAFETLSGIPGQDLTPEVLFDLLDKLETVKIATLANIIRTWLEQQQQRRKS